MTLVHLKCSMLTEQQEQQSFMAWMARFYPKAFALTYAVPNGRTSAREGAKYKAMGAKSGVPDVCVAIPVFPYHGLYIEFKRVDGGAGASETQKIWLENLNKQNYKAVIANGFEEARREFEMYLGETKMSSL